MNIEKGQYTQVSKQVASSVQQAGIQPSFAWKPALAADAVWTWTSTIGEAAAKEAMAREVAT